ncbi:DUF4348 domain-containing protein [Flectobacillus major]|uniref:DUF4348 domain-containing protein n=1 Tax=Flectobacillus major TaxID=103 RepID=UPI00131ED88D|nr:DUF4348 domain-containing protein [Flectobacillus major]
MKKTLEHSYCFIRIFFLICVLSQVTYLNCTADTKNQQEGQQLAIVEENFNDFYKKFYSDSLFQVSRVVFPLKGFNSDEYDEELGDKNPPYFWKKQGWHFLTTLEKYYLKIDKKDWVEEYKKVIKHNKDSTVLEKIYIVDSGYIIERKFKKIKGKWFLIFYSYKNF